MAKTNALPKAVASAQHLASPSGSTTDPAFEASSGQHPFTIGETPFRPYLRPHRIAQSTRDPGMIEALADRERSDRTADSLTTLAIIIGLAVTAYGSLFWLIGWMAGVL